MENTNKITWTSPSNIALIKYWGKKPIQMAENSSLSFTLKNSVTKMSIEQKASNEGLKVNFLFEKQVNENFSNKILKFLSTIIKDFPWLESSVLYIDSENTFPHSSGIASSASSMSALSLCILSLDELITKKQYSVDQFFIRASHFARLASGSASRSVFPGLVLWKKDCESAEAVKVVHPKFLTMRDSILIVNEGIKKVSSTAGHALMDSHPYREIRYRDAEKNLSNLLEAMKVGNFEIFSEIVEHEALSLHALMMTSSPSVVLLQPESLEIILKVREWRNVNKVPITFTIDAGPNIHLLYPLISENVVKEFIAKDLWQGKKVIHDEVGTGPQK